MDGVQDFWKGEYTYRCILTNDHEGSKHNKAPFVKSHKGSFLEMDQQSFILNGSCMQLVSLIYMQLVTPRVVPMAVRIEIKIWITVFQVSFFIIGNLVIND